jgi:hypothetical protein
MIDTLPTRKWSKKSLETFVRLEPLRFATMVRDTILEMDDAEHVMVLVAMLNLDSMTETMASANQGAPEAASICNLDNLLFLLALTQGRPPNGSPADRRLAWLKIAALVNRLGDLATRNRKLIRALQEIWIELVRSGGEVGRTLARDDTWLPAQTRTVLTLYERYQGRDFVTFELMPKWLFGYQTTRRFLRQNDVDLFPEVWRPLASRPSSF